MRRIRILAGLTLAAALPAAAHTFGFSPGSAPQACLAIGNTTYRLARGVADVTVRIDSTTAGPGLRVKLTETPEDADFVLVDDGAPPACTATSNIKNVIVAPGAAAPDLVVGFASGAAPADYRIYVRSRFIAPETAAVLFAAARMPPQTVAGRMADRSN
ncbi:MAG: hypothetical protein WDO17_01040 [Alphaproteobacteria bacterium]